MVILTHCLWSSSSLSGVVIVSIIWLCRLRCHLFRGFLLEFCANNSVPAVLLAAEWTTNNNLVRSVVSLFVSEHRTCTGNTFLRITALTDFRTSASPPLPTLEAKNCFTLSPYLFLSSHGGRSTCPSSKNNSSRSVQFTPARKSFVVGNYKNFFHVHSISTAGMRWWPCHCAGVLTRASSSFS